jgi:glycine/D-amino acid oxidase-like deaminating enzyme
VTGAPTADVVVIGAGAFGATTAYHLARRGAAVALLDQHALASQTSPRAAGLTSQAASHPTMARLRHEACAVFERFEAEMGRSVDFHRSGSLKAAYTEAGEARLHADLETARGLGIPVALITPAEARRLAPTSSRGPPGRSATSRATAGWSPRRSPSRSPRGRPAWARGRSRSRR